MLTNPLKEGVLTVSFAGIGTVTRRMIKIRAIELAFIDGRTPQEVSPADWIQAKRELLGQPELSPREQSLETAPESERWDPVPGSTGHKVETAASEDEDADGRSDNEILVEQGLDDALLDRAKAASDYPRLAGY